MCPNRTFTLLILYYLAERSCHSGAKSAEIRKRSRGVSAPGFAPEKSAVTPLRPPFLLFFINACPGTFRGVIPASGFPVRRDRRKMRQTVKLFFIFFTKFLVSGRISASRLPRIRAKFRRISPESERFSGRAAIVRKQKKRPCFQDRFRIQRPAASRHKTGRFTSRQKKPPDRVIRRHSEYPEPVLSAYARIRPQPACGAEVRTAIIATERSVPNETD